MIHRVMYMYSLVFTVHTTVHLLTFITNCGYFLLCVSVLSVCRCLQGTTVVYECNYMVYCSVLCYLYMCRYAGMLKTHKQNLIPENEFHIREERVKAQQSDAKEKEREKESTKSESVKKEDGKSSSSSVASSSMAKAAVKVKVEENGGSSKTAAVSKGSSGKESAKEVGAAAREKEKEKEKDKEKEREKEKEKDKEKRESSTTSSTKSSRESSRERGASKDVKDKENGSGKITLLDFLF